MHHAAMHSPRLALALCRHALTPVTHIPCRHACNTRIPLALLILSEGG